MGIDTRTFHIESGLSGRFPCFVRGNGLDRASVLDLCDVDTQVVYYVTSDTFTLIQGEVNSSLDWLIFEEPELSKAIATMTD